MLFRSYFVGDNSLAFLSVQLKQRRNGFIPWDRFVCWWVGVFPSVGEKGKGIVAYEILSFSEHSAEQDEHGEQLTFGEIDAAPPVAYRAELQQIVSVLRRLKIGRGKLL